MRAVLLVEMVAAHFEWAVHERGGMRKMRRSWQPWLLSMLLATSARAGDLDALAAKVVGDARSATEKTRAIVRWTNANFDWTATDYKQRTVEEIVERKGGNCNEQAMVVRALLDRAGVKTRRIREINIQPESAQRQANAEAKIRELGFRYSVFGLRHNDHVWIEYFDDAAQEWYPADPTLNLVGLEEWERARVGFGERPTSSILPSRDMLVPIAVFAQQGQELEDRSDRYLVEGFDALSGHRLSATRAWSEWTKLIREIAPVAKGAFEGTADLHAHSGTIESLRKTYVALRASVPR